MIDPKTLAASTLQLLQQDPRRWILASACLRTMICRRLWRPRSRSTGATPALGLGLRMCLTWPAAARSGWWIRTLDRPGRDRTIVP